MKGKSIMEVLLVFIVFELILLAYKSTKFIKLELDSLGWSYVGGSLMIMIPVFLLLVTKKKFEFYGLTLIMWRENLDIGMIYALVRGGMIAVSFVLFWILGRNFTELKGAFIKLGLGIVVLFLILSILQRREKTNDPNNPPNPISNLAILILLLLLPIFMGIYLNKLTLVICSTVVWQFFISGFGEEILFRGYFQSRINEEFGRPFTFLGVNFGVGVIISSLLFAFAHVLNPFNPFAGEFELAWGWGFSSLLPALTFGLVREKTGSIIPVGIAHGLPDAVGETFMVLGYFQSF